ncbi:MAG: carbohydrate ABC transporter permease [Betaproteobacteria bacterium]
MESSIYLGTLARYLLTFVVMSVLCLGVHGALRLVRVREETAAGYALITPWLAGFLVFTAGPILASLGLSFTSYDLFSPPKWVGLENYRWLFSDILDFWPSVKLTLAYAFLSVPLGVAGSLLVALLLSTAIRGIGIFRTVYYLPAVLPEVSVALLWRWIFNSEAGLLNAVLRPLLRVVGLQNPDWFGDPRFVLPAFVIMSIWGVFGINMVVFLAAIKNVPRVFYEAAEIDGAGPLAKFWSVTFPQISPVVLLQVIMGIIGALQIFTVAMFARPTSAAGRFMNQLVYERGFLQLKMGEASAIAWVLFIIILALTLLVFRSSTAWVYYEAEVRK